MSEEKPLKMETKLYDSIAYGYLYGLNQMSFAFWLPVKICQWEAMLWQSKGRLEKNFQTQSTSNRGKFIKGKEQR